MGFVEVLDPVPPARTGGYKVDVSRGVRNGRVSSEWFNRHDDERYLSLDDLWANVKGSLRAQPQRGRADGRHPGRGRTRQPRAAEPGLAENAGSVAPTHWALGQLASIVGAPGYYLRQVPAPLAGINLQYGLSNHCAEQVKTLETEDGRTELRAVTGPDYGRIHDHEMVKVVQRIEGNGTDDMRWKVPGVRDGSNVVYNADVEIRRDTTTLYASDRDGFLFLVDDRNPIEAGNRMAPPISTSGSSIARNPMCVRRLSARRASPCGRCARTATSGVSRIFGQSASATRNTPLRALPIRRHQR